MALIICPDCKKQISDRADRCPHCGLPAKYFHGQKEKLPAPTTGNSNLDYTNLGNILLSFDKDYCTLFGASHYITHREEDHMNEVYREYYKTLCNKMIFQYVCNNARTFRVDIDSLKSFLTKMHTLSNDVTTHNTNYMDRVLKQEKAYFDHILEDIDPIIKLDEEQRRAVITDDDHCLLVAGAGAGKTTTMAAKVKYLVEKQGVHPEEIIVILTPAKPLVNCRSVSIRASKSPQRSAHSISLLLISSRSSLWSLRKSISLPMRLSLRCWKNLFSATRSSCATWYYSLVTILTLRKMFSSSMI